VCTRTAALEVVVVGGTFLGCCENARQNESKEDSNGREKKRPVEIRYDKDGNKIYVNFSDDNRDEDYHLESDATL
jgi:hypothetical protein